MILSFEGISLRAVEPEDLELLYLWENNDTLWSQSNTLVPFSKFTLKRYIDNSHKSLFETGQLRLMIDLSDEKKTIGTIDLFDFDHFHGRAGLGILIASEDDRHKGYATMAMSCIIKYAFTTLQLHQLWCNILETNKQSLALFEKSGFTICGKRKEWIKSENIYLDEYMLQLINI
jgi:diamine N-acetyltransferase